MYRSSYNIQVVVYCDILDQFSYKRDHNYIGPGCRQDPAKYVVSWGIGVFSEFHPVHVVGMSLYIYM